jgi:D-tyrosyl-tRNA(Tyr) deacylase
MIALLQRVSEARVDVEGVTLGAIGPGLLAFVCAVVGDEPADAERLAAKTARLRIFADDTGRMNRALLETGGAVLAISQFTLAADTRRGNRPGFSAAAPPDVGEALYDRFCGALANDGLTVARGRFGAHMAVRLINDGPVTIWLDTKA